MSVCLSVSMVVNAVLFWFFCGNMKTRIIYVLFVYALSEKLYPNKLLHSSFSKYLLGEFKNITSFHKIFNQSPHITSLVLCRLLPMFGSMCVYWYVFWRLLDHVLLQQIYTFHCIILCLSYSYL